LVISPLRRAMIAHPMGVARQLHVWNIEMFGSFRDGLTLVGSFDFAGPDRFC
jgi:hypothetical protein